jgi:hypothetical protein
MKLKLTQSGISKILKNGDKLDLCWLKWKTKFIDGLKSEPSEYMMKGHYFEHLIGSNPDSPVRELKLARGKKSADQQRLEQQALIFKKLAIERKMIVNADNTQVNIYYPWSKPKCPKCNSEDVETITNISSVPMVKGECKSCLWSDNIIEFVDVYLHGTMDILSPFLKYKSELLPLANIDIKITQSIETTYGNNQWANIQYKDYIQPILYHYIFYKLTGRHLHHVFLVFDYKPKFSHKIVYKTVSDFELKSLENDINRCIALIHEAQKKDWPVCSSDENCRYCPLGNHYNEKYGFYYGNNTCKFYNLTKEEEI